MAACVACLCALLLSPGHARAHPIVSTDVNRHVTLTVADDSVEIRYLYEMLEIAAIDTARTWDVDGDGSAAPGERDAFVAEWSASLVRDVSVTLDGTPVPLSLASARWELGEGAFGLKTWRVTALLTGRLPVQRQLGALEYVDRLRPDEVGWKEIVLVARGGTTVARASVPAHDRSYELTDYDAMSALPNPNETYANAVLRFPPAVIAAGSPTPDPEAGGQPAARRVEPSAVPPLVQRSAPARVPRSAPAPARMEASTDSAAAPAMTSEVVPVRSPALSATLGHYGWSFFRLGMHHIATGLDHMLFLLGLLLFRQSLGRLALVITCFTLAHSVTLVVAAAGWVTPPGAAIEALVALSIVYVGAASLWRPDSGHGPWIALGFGLVHGFGFAGALQQALGGVTGDRAWLVALAAFNLGIEALQLIAVAAVWPLLRHIDRLKRAPLIRSGLSAAVLLAGAWWLLARLAPT